MSQRLGEMLIVEYVSVIIYLFVLVVVIHRVVIHRTYVALVAHVSFSSTFLKQTR
jgi:hypothetical protein